MKTGGGWVVLALLPVLAGGCADTAPDPLLGAWQNGRDEVEFLGDGTIRLHIAGGVQPGRYRRLGPGRIEVDLGSVWPSGRPKLWLAMPRGDQLGLCEIRNGRHCLRFARPGRQVEVAPR